MNLFEELANILLPDADRMRALRAVQSLNLPDCWIGAGFVRDAVWDRLHGYAVCPPKGDIDVVWFDRQQTGIDNDLENALAALDPDFTWSVKNQARMHLHNGDAPYQAVSDAMRFWPEIATAGSGSLNQQKRAGNQRAAWIERLVRTKAASNFRVQNRKTGHFPGPHR